MATAKQQGKVPARALGVCRALGFESENRPDPTLPRSEIDGILRRISRSSDTGRVERWRFAAGVPMRDRLLAVRRPALAER